MADPMVFPMAPLRSQSPAIPETHAAAATSGGERHAGACWRCGLGRWVVGDDDDYADRRAPSGTDTSCAARHGKKRGHPTTTPPLRPPRPGRSKPSHQPCRHALARPRCDGAGREHRQRSFYCCQGVAAGRAVLQTGRPALRPASRNALAGGCTGQATADLATALALGGAAGHIAFGWLGPGLAEHHDGVQRSVQLSVTVPLSRWRTTRRRRPGSGRRRPAWRRRPSGAQEPTRMRPADQHLGGGDRTDPRLANSAGASTATSIRSSSANCLASVCAASVRSAVRRSARTARYSAGSLSLPGQHRTMHGPVQARSRHEAQPAAARARSPAAP